jgi:ribosome biogenesis GTPase A
MEIKKNFRTKFWTTILGKNPKNRRIWTEFIKVVTASDIILYILDSRDPLGTFFRSIQKKIKKVG